jgi:hypothetical protein
VRTPLGTARTKAEAEALLGEPAVAAREALPWRYRSRARLMNRWGHLVEAGLGDVLLQDGLCVLALAYWAPASPRSGLHLAPAERTALAERMAAPLRGVKPQAPLDIGLFERLAPENPAVVLAEEGDGRRHQE